MVILGKKVPTKPVVLGKIGSCYGTCGWLKVFSFTQEAKSIFDYQPWFIRKVSNWKEIKLEKWCYHNKNIIIKLKAFDDRNTANLLTNCQIIVDSFQLPKLKEGSYYWKDLIGCHVVTVKGYNLGKVIDIMETKSNDILIVKASLKESSFSTKNRLIPFLSERVIKKIELANQIIKVDWDPIF